jgi:GNAT superfamily N-acetyltransferase
MELRPVREEDLASFAGWLPHAAAGLGCDGWSSEAALREAIGRHDVLAAVEGEPIGLLVYEAGSPRPDATRVRLIVVEPDRRRLGTGSRAALALEERLADTAERIYVCVPARLGLAFYFWLRLGYQPLTQAAWPSPPEDPPSAWMVREL